MSYLTEFWFNFAVTPHLAPKHERALQALADRARPTAEEAADEPTCPSWPCAWEPIPDGSGIRWTGNRKVDEYEAWLRYLIAHYLAPEGYVLSGDVRYSGEGDGDEGVIHVVNNVVTMENTVTFY